MSQPELIRLPGWKAALDGYLDAHRSRSFEYGVADCCLFAAGAVAAMTGSDPAAELRGYAGRREAYAIVKRYGSIAALVTALLRRRPVLPIFADDGDVLLGFQPDGGETLAVCRGAHAVGLAANGILTDLRTMDFRLAWRI